MTEKFYKRHTEHFFRDKRARLLHQVQSEGGELILAGYTVTIKRKYKGLGCLHEESGIYVSQVKPEWVELEVKTRK